MSVIERDQYRRLHVNVHLELIMVWNNVFIEDMLHIIVYELYILYLDYVHFVSNKVSQFKLFFEKATFGLQ